jgi:autonomous glycyl radical cofactor
MIKGIQITQAANDNLLNSFWLLDSEKNEARCLCAKAEFAEDQVVAVSELGQIEYRELPVNVAPTVKVEGGQHLNVNVLRRETLEDAVNNPGKAYHKIVNAHIYEDQLELMRDVQLKREPFPSPQLEINPDIKTLEDLETWVTMDDFKVVGYQSHEPIKYPFSV